jgi:hypothetical protein
MCAFRRSVRVGVWLLFWGFGVMWARSPDKVQAATQPQAESSKDSAASIARLIDAHKYDEANVAILRLIAADPGTTGEYVADLSSTLPGEVCNKYGIPAAQASAQLLRRDLDAYWAEARRIGALTNNEEAVFSLARKDAQALVNLATACSAQCFDDEALNQSCLSLVQNLGFTDSETSCSESPRYLGECVPYNLLRHVVDNNPTNSPAWTKLAAFYLDGLRDGDKGAEAAEQALLFKPDNREALRRLVSHLSLRCRKGSIRETLLQRILRWQRRMVSHTGREGYRIRGTRIASGGLGHE